MKKGKMPTKKRAEYTATCFVGRKGSGKTTLARFFLEKYKKLGILTIAVDPNGDEYGADYYFSTPSEAIQLIKNSNKSCAVFIDELPTYLNRKNQTEADIIKKLLFRHRHYCIDVIYSTQYLISLSPHMREQFDYIYLLNVSERERETVKEQFFLTKSELKLIDAFNAQNFSKSGFSKFVLRFSIKTPKIQILKI